MCHERSILVNSPGGSMQASYCCLPTSLSLRGVEFKVSPIVLRTSGIDVILGIDWIKQNQAVILVSGEGSCCNHTERG